jgi:anti-sigma B factor antagonist
MATIRPSGDLDLAAVESFRRLVQQGLTDAPDELVIDAADVTFLDSSGIAVIAGAVRQQRGRGGTVQVTNCQPIVKRALELVGLGMLLAP